MEKMKEKKEYASKYFDLEYLKKTDIQQVGGSYVVCNTNLKPNIRAEYGEDINNLDDENIEFTTIWANDIYDSVIDTDDIDYNSYEWFEDEWKEFVINLMNCKYDKYLVVAFNSTWTGASGYSIKDSYEDCFIRNYDCSQYYDKSSLKGKVLQLKEYHHDCPMGHKTVIIGLTEQEFEKLDNMNVEEVINWAKERELN